MKIQDLGHRIRIARNQRGMTQQALADASGVSRTTLNLLENGLARDIGLEKAEGILAKLGLSLTIEPAPPARADFVKMASTSASVSARESIDEKQLRRILLTGKLPRIHRAHIRRLLEESPIELIRSLLDSLRARHKAGRVESNLRDIAADLQIQPSKVDRWLTD